MYETKTEFRGYKLNGIYLELIRKKNCHNFVDGGIILPREAKDE